MQPTN